MPSCFFYPVCSSRSCFAPLFYGFGDVDRRDALRRPRLIPSRVSHGQTGSAAPFTRFFKTRRGVGERGRGCRRPESVGRLRRWGGGGVSEMARRRGSEILLCMDVCDLRMSRMSFGCFAAPTHDGMAGVCGYCPNVDVFLRRAWAGIRDAVCFCDYCY